MHLYYLWHHILKAFSHNSNIPNQPVQEKRATRHKGKERVRKAQSEEDGEKKGGEGEVN